MQYFLHKEGGHVAALDDHEKPDHHTLVGGPEMYIPVHLHPGPGGTRREPTMLAKVIVTAFSLAVMGGVLAAIVGGLALLWKAVFA